MGGGWGECSRGDRTVAKLLHLISLVLIVPVYGSIRHTAFNSGMPALQANIHLVTSAPHVVFSHVPVT